MGDGGDGGDGVSADTGDLRAFVERGGSFVESLAVLDEHLGRIRAVTTDRLGGLGPAPPARPSARDRLAELRVEASNNNRFVDEIRNALSSVSGVVDGVATTSGGVVDRHLADAGFGGRGDAGGDLGADLPFEDDRALAARLRGRSVAGLPASSPLREAVLAGRVDPPTTVVRDAVVAAMVEGLTPEQAGVDRVYFSGDYLAVQRLDRVIAGLGDDRDEADGWPLLPFDDDRDTLARLDGQLERAGAEREAIAGRIGANRSGRLTVVEAVAAVGDWTDARLWEGGRYGSWVLQHRGEVGRDPLGGDPHASDTHDELAFIGARLAAADDAALGFYQRLGAEATAGLPTLVAASFLHDGDLDARRVALDDFGSALGAASRSAAPDGGAALGFSGDDLVEAVLPALGGGRHVHPAVLLATGDYDPRFLAAATAATVVRAEEAATGDWGPGAEWLPQPWEAEPAMGSVVVYGYGPPMRGGEDPRNILLARASEEPEAAALAVAELTARDPGLGSLLSARVPYRRAGAGRSDGYVGPGLAVDWPVTAFLVAAGRDDAAARAIIHAGASSDRGLDEAVAGGIDGLLAQHAAIMYHREVLDDVGIDPPTLNEIPDHGFGAEIDPIQAAEWRAVHAKIRAQGRGDVLALATEMLLTDAVAGALDPGGDSDSGGDFDPELVENFALIAGYVTSESDDARIAHAAALDERAAERNRQIDGTVSTALSLGGLLPQAAVPAAGASVAWAWLHDGEPADRELLETRRQLIDERLGVSDAERYTGLVQQAHLERLVGQGRTTIEMTLDPGSEPERVAIGRSPDTGLYRWLDPATGEWHDFPTREADRHQLATGPLDRSFDTGEHVADDHRAGARAAGRNAVDFAHRPHIDDIAEEAVAGIVREGGLAGRTPARELSTERSTLAMDLERAYARVVETGIGDWIGNG